MTTERIDVLAVMHKLGLPDAAMMSNAQRAEYAKVREAFVELVEAARSASATLGHIYHTTPLSHDLAQHAHDGYQRLDAALAAAVPTPQKRHCDHDWVVKTVPTGFADVCCLCGADKGAALARVGGAS